jgi:hypothetical protein
VDSALAELPPEFAATVVLVDIEEPIRGGAGVSPVHRHGPRLARGRRLLAALPATTPASTACLRPEDR